MGQVPGLADIVTRQANVLQQIIVQLLQPPQIALGEPAANQAAPFRECESAIAGEGLMEGIIAHDLTIVSIVSIEPLDCTGSIL